MSARLRHLGLPVAGKPFKIRGRPWHPPEKAERNHVKFAKTQISNLDTIIRNHPFVVDGYKQDLTFKIRTLGRVNDSTFRDNLKSVGIEALVSMPESSDSDSRQPSSDWLVSASDSGLEKLKIKLKTNSKDSPFGLVDMIDSFYALASKEKLGPMLRTKRLGKGGSTRVVVHLLAESKIHNRKKLEDLERRLKDLVEKHGFGIYDRLKTNNLNVLLIGCNGPLLKKLLKFNLVLNVDHVSEFGFDRDPMPVVNLFPTVNRTSRAKTGILVTDSGIVRHPLLDAALSGRRLGLRDRNTGDLMRHGTSVAGCALYGNLDGLSDDAILDSKFNIYTAKIFYETKNRIELDPSRLYLSIFKECIDAVAIFPDCKVVNISFGDPKKTIQDGMLQPEFSTLVDDLSLEYPRLVFTVAMGNTSPASNPGFSGRLLGADSDRARMASPASSIHALSVGALEKISPKFFVPSDVVNTGPGLNRMIKPDLVEVGGGTQHPIRILNRNFLERPLTKGLGTSYSAPIVANHLAELMDVFPSASRNLIMSLLLSSCSYPSVPKELEKIFTHLTEQTTQSDFMTRSNMYGFGLPNLGYATHSSSDRVALVHEGKIRDGQVQCFEISIPSGFATLPGKRTVTVSLVFDPKVDRYRSEYFSTRLKFHMYRNRSLNDLMKKHSIPPKNITPEMRQFLDDMGRDEIKFAPSVELRSLSPHQRGCRILTSYKINPNKPLMLEVTRKDKWKTDDTPEQKYAITVTLEHEAKMNLYGRLRRLNQARQSPRVRI